MFRLPYGERVDPMEEKRQARENTISSVITFAILCAAIRVGIIFRGRGFDPFDPRLLSIKLDVELSLNGQKVTFEEVELMKKTRNGQWNFILT
ncbi:hypothetical protein SFRURICE_017828 [Spodoptera frugiperda]|nr:hypothetical protein SFRURICE_017828 [Spodoptera frugiperda]